MNQPDDLAVAVIQLALWNHRIERALAAEEGLPVNELHCLLQLFFTEPESASGLASVLGIRDTSLSKLLRKLELQGEITRCPDQINRRIERVTLTPKGRDVVQRTLDRAAEIGRNLVGQLPEDRQSKFVQCLGVIASSGDLALAHGSACGPVDGNGGHLSTIHKRP